MRFSDARSVRTTPLRKIMCRSRSGDRSLAEMKFSPALLCSALFLTGTLAACDGGGGVLKDAEAKSKAACECADTECVKEYVKWFNETSLKDGGKALEGLSDEDKAKYEGYAIEAGDCQLALKMGEGE